MFRYRVDNPTFLKETVLALADDLSLPWNTYPCLEWPRALFKEGYGMVYKAADTPSGKTQCRAHREAYALVYGPIEANLMICHHCDNPKCYRPIHLFAGTNSDNVLDCVAKGRYANYASKHPEIFPRGEDHWNSKLKKEDVLKIRELYAAGELSQPKIGKLFGVSQTLISLVVRRVIWAHI